MERSEEQPGAGPEAAPRRRREQLRHHILTAAVAAGVLLFALAFFMAGFAAHALLDEDEEDGSGEGGGGGSAAGSAADDPSWGPADAPVTIEEFGDFQCPYCARFATQTLPKIKETYAGKVRFVFRDFPLTAIHQFAQKATEAAQCAHEQGRFWEYHDLLFTNQQALTAEDLKRYAQQVGMDAGKFSDCLDSGKNAREVMLDLQDGKRAGVSGTPAFLINGLLMSGAQPFEQFQAAIEQALAARGE